MVSSSRESKEAFVTYVRAELGHEFGNAEVLQLLIGTVVTAAGGAIFSEAAATTAAAATALTPVLIAVGLILIIVGVGFIAGPALFKIKDNLLNYLKEQIGRVVS